jgi:two-component system, LuxR family, response regulator FixJ
VASEIARPRIVVIDDDAAIRDAIGLMVESAGFQVESFESAEEFLKKPLAHDVPTCFVVDLRLGGLSGLGLQQQLLRAGVRIPLIFLTGFADISSAVQATRAGAFDFLEKPLHRGVLLERIAKALDHDAELLLAENERTAIGKQIESLSPRERDVCDLLVQGKSNKEIARALRIGMPTVTKHRAKVMSKCGVRNVVELAAIVERHRKADPLEGAPQSGIATDTIIKAN